jgi:hypothetical protein
MVRRITTRAFGIPTYGFIDAVPRKRVPYSSVMDNLYKRIEFLEKLLADHKISSAAATGDSSEAENNVPSSLPISSKTNSLFLLGRYDRALMLDIFFQEHKNLPFAFVHEETARQSVLEETASFSFIQSIYAITWLYVKPQFPSQS